MPQLTLPTTAVHSSFLTAMVEFRDEGRGVGDDRTMLGRDISEYAGGWRTRPRSVTTSAWSATRPGDEAPARPGW